MLTDEQILQGFRSQDDQITRDYFYGYCRIAYYICDNRYHLHDKLGLDFYSLAHEYYLTQHRLHWKPLEDRKPGSNLKDWMLGGFRFLVLDKLKGYNQDQAAVSIEDRNRANVLAYSIEDPQFKQDFYKTVDEICDHCFSEDRTAQSILRMILIDGYKGKEIAQWLQISPSAVSQRYHQMMENIVIPYFRQTYTYAPSVLFECADILGLPPLEQSNPATELPRRLAIERPRDYDIYVFGSDLQGMHGGGTAYIALREHGAILGQGVGLQGRSYAIPTMQGGVETIRPYVDTFLAFAKDHQELTFLVTPIGCGIAGFTPQEIAPLFEQAIAEDNIDLPKAFLDELF